MIAEKLAVIGTGYVGLVSAACLAELGNNVLAIDIDAAKIAAIQNGVMPIFEPGLAEIVARNIANGRLRFSPDARAVADANLVMLAVGTPSAPDGSVDLSYVWQAVDGIAPYLSVQAVVIGKSTLPIGTGRQIADRIRAKAGVIVATVSNPEFLREGQAVQDFMRPDRIVLGADDPLALTRVENLYRPLIDGGTPVLRTGLESSELIKYAANAFLATKVAFINEMADLAEAVGADITAVSAGMGLDPRIGTRFLQPGPGYGGSCFPKDTNALAFAAQAVGTPAKIVTATIAANANRSGTMIRKIETALGGVAGKTLAVLGLAFKAGTDDVRAAPALLIIDGLLAAGAKLRAFDPKAGDAVRTIYSAMMVADTIADALRGADAAVIVTEWPEFAVLTPVDFNGLRLKTVIDLRNLFDPELMAEAGINYFSVGRKKLPVTQHKAAAHG